MAVVLRLTRRGRSKRPFYRIVATEHTSRRDGKYIEIIGTFNPLTKPATLVLKEDRVRHYVEHGATPSKVLRDLIRKQIPNFIEAREKHQLEKIRAARKARKARAKSGGKAAPAKSADKPAKKTAAKKA